MKLYEGNHRCVQNPPVGLVNKNLSAPALNESHKELPRLLPSPFDENVKNLICDRFLLLRLLSHLFFPDDL